MHPFVLNARFEAKSIFQKLDSRFDPRISFVGFPIHDPSAGPGVGPEDTPFGPEDFSNLLARAANLAKEDPESESCWMPDPIHGWTEAHERLQKSKEQRVLGRALWRALTDTANSAPANEGFIAYCSWPVEYDDKNVMLILQLQKDIHNAYYHLKQGSYRDKGGFHEYRRERSLIDSLAREYLAEEAKELTSGNAGAGWHNIRDQDSLYLRAAKELMYSPAIAGGNDEGLHGLFDVCNNLSTVKYEGKEGVGRVVFTRPNHPNVHVEIALTNPVQLRSVGAVRKLLQMASGNIALLSDSYWVYGLGWVLPAYDLSTEDVFTVHYLKQFVWALRHGEHPLMHVRYGEPSITLPGFPEERFRRDLPRMFGGISTAAVNGLCKIGDCFAAQKQGCMLVISAAAKEEAERLNAQCTRVEPFHLTESVIPQVTAIDGSVLIDIEGNCHAVGAILDGMASPKCSPDRGSRYNSAVRYVYGRHDAMAIVKSEDGMLSVLPELRAQIRRSEILQRIATLREIAAHDTFEIEALSEVMKWLEEHEFYLTQGECNEANRLHKETQAKKPDDVMYVVRPEPLTPNPDMNNSYYLPE